MGKYNDFDLDLQTEGITEKLPETVGVSVTLTTNFVTVSGSNVTKWCTTTCHGACRP